MVIVTVLREGKDFSAKHAQWMHKQLKNYNSICLTNIENISGVKTAPLLYEWKGWWAKIELFNPDHPIIGNEDILYFDIDTVILGDITPLMQMKDFTMLTDFLDPNSFNSSVMFIPKSVKHYVWNDFVSNPQKIMSEYITKEKWGDQAYISSITQPKSWQEILPKKIVSYKADIAIPSQIGYDKKLSTGKGFGKPTEDMVVVCFHGYPRPWKTAFSWVPYFSIGATISGKIKSIKYRLQTP